jgi:hypothetical protein
VPEPHATPAEKASDDRAAELHEIQLGLRRQLPSNIFVQFLAGMGVSEARKLKTLKTENPRLKMLLVWHKEAGRAVCSNTPRARCEVIKSRKLL